jgi:hypothetical protein
MIVLMEKPHIDDEIWNLCAKPTDEMTGLTVNAGGIAFSRSVMAFKVALLYVKSK